MKVKSVLLNLVAFLGIAALITASIYLVDLWLLSGNTLFSPIDAMFFEGILFLLIGLMLLLGRGGITPTSRRAALLSALAEAMFNADTPSPSEIFRRDEWKPQGFTRLALILIFAGVLMILTYFITV